MGPSPILQLGKKYRPTHSGHSSTAASIPARSWTASLHWPTTTGLNAPALNHAVYRSSLDATPTRGAPTAPAAAIPLPPVVNWHLEKRCNYGCNFCFATFEDIPTNEVQRDKAKLLEVPRMLKAAGATKITFVGGEPFLHPHIEELIGAAKAAGLITTAVTNGSRLDAARLMRLKGKLDWLAFSIDASSDDIHASLGRGMAHELSQEANRLHSHKHNGESGTSNSDSTSNSTCNSSPDSGSISGKSTTTASATQDLDVPNAPADASPRAAVPQPAPANNQHLARIMQLWPLAQELGYRLKLNTVVCRSNLHDDMVPLVRELKPDRWKVFQVLPVDGQNSGCVEKLLISAEEFSAYVSRHRAEVSLIAEDNCAMVGTYAMLDARCRFYTNAANDGHAHVYGPDLWEAGSVEQAWSQVAGRHFDAAKFLGRDGLYSYGQDEQAAAQESAWVKVATA